ncbi:amino acid transporter [Hortaea werneckii]|nr:amino acid transporter [Hortaea werneckii]KAI7102758.1 amino acid transporter [Hortaea werneckii]KAI7224135.1 amino acid transporter [Hortaea werneckii]KAI7300106.1 amino acid transporter [Hortaea werneckii]KAI7383098.1 amino acid transporter [Hortaea werneckii]
MSSSTYELGSVVKDDKGADIERQPSEPKHGTVTEVTGSGVDNAGYHRRLSKRQIMMMTFGAGIGTGLWVGTGNALKYAGPAGTAVAYTIVAYVVWLQYTAIGEMTAYRPVHGGFIRQEAEYVDRAFGFATGINFWFEWVMIIPAEITAAVSVLQFWPATQAVPLAAYITMFLAVMVIGNVFNVRIYGHIEYVMSFVKIIAVIAMIFFLFIMASGGVAATGGPLVFHYWKHPGAFNNGMKGVAKAFTQAGFSFGGGEHIAVIAGEAKEPRKTVKSTIYPIFWRMFSFFVLNIWLVGMCVPYDDEDLVSASGTLGSPFVIAALRAKESWLAHALNGFIFLSVISCGITSFYVASRSLTALADLKLVHPLFGAKDKAGRPWISLLICGALGGGLCYLNCNKTAIQVYNWFSSLVGIARFINWGAIFITQIRFRAALKAQGISPETLPFKAPLAPWAHWFGLVIIVFILACEFYISVSPIGEPGTAVTFFANYLGMPLFLFDFVAYKLWFRTKLVKPSEVDFSEAKMFDEEDRLARAMMDDEALQKEDGLGLWQKAKNLVLG